MNKTLTSAVLILLAIPALSLAGEYLTDDERRALGCGKTFDGKNEITGSEYRIYQNDDCTKNTIHILKGKNEGKTFTRTMVIYPSGEACVKVQGRDRCSKLKDAGDGTYHGIATNGKHNGKHRFTLTNFLEGNQL